MKKRLNWIMFAVMLAACTSIDKNETNGKASVGANGTDTNTAAPASQSKKNNIGYDFENPSQVHPMPRALREISGLAVISSSEVACVQDEEGSIFLFDLDKQEIQERIPFTGKGDFEELAIIGTDAYVLESNGTIFFVPDYRGSGSARVEKLSTSLGKANNAEGMCYDKTNKRLLIACKGKGEEKQHNRKAIYAYDPATRTLSAEPVFELSLKRIKETIEKMPHHMRKHLDKILESGNIDDVFTPSGICIHPATGDLYVLSTRNNLLGVLGPAGDLKEIVPLRNELFIQPEGISFAPNGDLYISNEGGKGAGNILMFTYEKK